MAYKEIASQTNSVKSQTNIDALSHAGLRSLSNMLDIQRHPCLVGKFKLTFLHFKQYYIYFHIYFYSHIFQKTTKNIIQTILPNTP